MNMTLEEFIRRINIFLEHSKNEDVYSEGLDQINSTTISDRHLPRIIEKAQSDTHSDA
jgi:hypothetical protein